MRRWFISRHARSAFVGKFLIFLAHYGLFGIFASMFIESCGLPFPTEGAFIVSQQLIVGHHDSFWFMYCFICLGQILGSVVAYGLGKLIHRGLGRWLASHEGYKRASGSIHGWYKKYGSLTVLICRLVGYVRPWSSLVAGAADFDFWPFLLWTTVGTLLIVYPSMKVTAFVFLLWQHKPFLHIYISVGFLISFFALVLYGIYHRAVNKK